MTEDEKVQKETVEENERRVTKGSKERHELKEVKVKLPCA
jgi:hypothetical protein